MDWKKLNTIASFDDRQRLCFSFQDVSKDINAPFSNVNCMATEQNIEKLIFAKPTTSTSLLIESLVQLLCRLLEEDVDIAELSYQAICKNLHDMSLIDDSYTLNEWAEMRDIYQKQVYKIIRGRGEDMSIALPNQDIKESIETCWSRYRKEFQEVSFIAGGGFGKVYRARHKLDCVEYAVKKIKINSTTIRLCHLAEVKTIASLNHSNIVQYKAAWLEPYFSSKGSVPYSSTTNSTCEQSQYNDFRESYSEVFERNESESNSLGHNSDKNMMTYSSKNICSQEIVPNSKSAILYIQMSLCQLTLQHWLQERNNQKFVEQYYLEFFKASSTISHMEVVHDIFCQILCGLEYIHSKNIIHHDIKPSNIFLGVSDPGKIIVQLGDFGLACPLQDDHSGIAIGTKLYAAPEQLIGECNPKSDIYSLGIVLLELLMTFKTDMERIKTIENARKGIFPSEIGVNSLSVLKSLMANEKDRPSTKELLAASRKIKFEHPLLYENDTNINKNGQSLLKTKQFKKNEGKRHTILELLQEKNNEILQLRSLLESKNKKIAELSEQLKEFQIKDNS